MDTDRWHLAIDTESRQRTTSGRVFLPGAGPKVSQLRHKHRRTTVQPRKTTLVVGLVPSLEVSQARSLGSGAAFKCVCALPQREEKGEGRVFPRVHGREDGLVWAGATPPEGVEGSARRTAQASRPGRGHSSRATGTSAVPEILVARCDRLRAKQNQNNLRGSSCLSSRIFLEAGPEKGALLEETGCSRALAEGLRGAGPGPGRVRACAEPQLGTRGTLCHLRATPNPESLLGKVMQSPHT